MKRTRREERAARSPSTRPAVEGRADRRRGRRMGEFGRTGFKAGVSDVGVAHHLPCFP